MKSNEGIVVDSEDFTMNTNWKNMQPNKYLCVNKKNLAKKYFEMPAKNAVENDDYRKYGEQHVELLNGDPPLNISWKNQQQNMYLRVDKKLLVKYYEMQKMMEETKRNNLYQYMQLNKYLCVNRKSLVKKYFEMPAGNAEEDDDYIKQGERHVELLNDDPPLNVFRKTLLPNKNLRVDKKHLVKNYYELLKMMVQTERNNLYQARLTSQCSFESRCESL